MTNVIVAIGAGVLIGAAAAGGQAVEGLQVNVQTVCSVGAFGAFILWRFSAMMTERKEDSKAIRDHLATYEANTTATLKRMERKLNELPCMMTHPCAIPPNHPIAPAKDDDTTT